MAGVETVSTLTNSIRSRYNNRYFDQVWYKRTYDRLASPVGDDMNRFIKGTEIVFPFIGKMDIETTAISETVDVVPQTLADATTGVAPTSRAGALQQSELLRIQNYNENFKEVTVDLVGENAAESIDLVAQNAALQGNAVFRSAARASLDAGTAADRLSDAAFDEAGNALYEFKVPKFMEGAYPDGGGDYFAIVHPDAYTDLRTGGNIVDIAKYQKPEIIMGSELAYKAPFRIIVPEWAKVFGGAGADNGTAVATTLSSAATKLSKTIVVASATNITVGRYVTIGTEETGSTHYETNERVYVVSASGTTVTIIGAGSNGGLRHNHASGVAVRNADSVYPVAYGTMGSIMKWWEPSVGPYGEIVGPGTDGLVKQWTNIGWKWYGAYARVVESHILRGEYSSSLDA